MEKVIRMSKRRRLYDNHHLLFTRHDWDNSYGKLLRAKLVYRVPIELHRQLHSQLKLVPLPDDAELRFAWERYQAEKQKVDAMSMGRACDWLLRYIYDDQFQEAIKIQRLFTIKYDI